MTAVFPPPRPSPGLPHIAAEVRLRPERPQDADQVDALIAQAFGPGRYAKTAERVREGAQQRLDLSMCAWWGATLLGAVRLWSISIGEDPALFLGPVEVRLEHRRHGLAAALVQRACDAARTGGARAVLLVGDAPIFGPMGFEAVPRGRVSLPGPVDPGRLFWRALRPDATADMGGRVNADRRPTCGP